MKTVQERFEEKYIPEPMSGCWLWTAALINKAGYGAFKYHGRVQGAHRVSWKINVGSIHDGLQVLHKCDNPACVNPGHLFLGSNEDNVADRVSKGRSSSGSGNGNARLVEADVREIRSLAGTMLQREIAELYSITKAYVGHIHRKRVWKHV